MKSNLDLPDALARLKFIGRIKEGEKVFVNSLTVRPNNWKTNLRRALFGGSREETLEFIENTLETAFNCLVIYSASDRASDRDICGEIATDIETACDGIRAIQRTYADDLMFVCRAEMLASVTMSRLSEFKAKINHTV